MYNFSFGKCRLQDSFDVKRIQMNFSISLASQSKSIDMFDKPQCAQILTIKSNTIIDILIPAIVSILILIYQLA